MLKKVLFFACLISSLVFMASAAQAQNFNAGLLLGASSVSNGGGTNATYGLDFGYKLGAAWGLGLNYTSNPVTATSPLTSAMTMTMLTGKYYFGSGFSAGLKLGTAATSYSGAGAPANVSNSAWGIFGGYNYSMNALMSLGADLCYISVSSTPSTTSMQLLGNIKFWF